MKVLLIDLENCSNQFDELKQLENYSQVVIFYTQTDSKFPINWLEQLTKVAQAEKLTTFQLEKHTAQMQIGILIGNSHDAKIDIVSSNTDWDYVVTLLNGQGREARRIQSTIMTGSPAESVVKETITTVNPSSANAALPFEYDNIKSFVDYYLELLKKQPKPTMLTGFENDIIQKRRNSFGITPELVMKELRSRSLGYYDVTKEKIIWRL